MHLTAELRYPAPVDRFGALLSDEDFWRWCTEALGGTVESVDITSMPRGGFTATRRWTLASDLIPSPLHPVVGDRLEIRQTEAWAPEADGERPGTVSMEILGAQVRISGTVGLAPEDTGCVHRYDGTATASIPLFGAALEEAAVDMMLSILRAEESVGRRWLTEY